MRAVSEFQNRRAKCRLLAGVLLLLSATSLRGEPGAETKLKPGAPAPLDLYERGEWEWSFESAYTFGAVTNVFKSLYYGYIRQPNPIDYQFATQALAIRYRLNDPGGPWFLRGSWQASLTFIGTAIVNGPESYFFGGAIGLRYDFVQPRLRLVPYIEARFGPGAIDSTGVDHGQTTDLVFTYLINIGLRYEINPKWSLSVSMLDQHISNAGIDPDRNNGVDSLGISVGVLKRF